MATDTRTAKLPVGSYILNYGASKTYPWMKQVAGMFNTDNGDMENYQNAILTNNEIYVPPDGVEAIGVEKLEYMNNEPKEGAHDSINNLMVMNTLKNLKPMYGGGEVKPMMGYEDGGLAGYQPGGAVQQKTLYGAGVDLELKSNGTNGIIHSPTGHLRLQTTGSVGILLS